jgi:hypothetical protein
VAKIVIFYTVVARCNKVHATIIIEIDRIIGYDVIIAEIPQVNSIIIGIKIVIGYGIKASSIRRKLEANSIMIRGVVCYPVTIG